MSEAGSGTMFGVGMSIIGYEVGYVRKPSADPSTPILQFAPRHIRNWCKGSGSPRQADKTGDSELL
jgi:hypothetical protein